MTKERKWVPAFLVDEITPTPRAHPDHWLIAECLFAPGWMVTDPGDEDSAVEHIDVGETMAFAWFVDHGELTFMISRDGSFTTDRPIPAEATHFYEISDADTLNYSPEDFARAWADNYFDLNDEGVMDVTVGAYQWSDEDVTFRLGLVEGKPHFEEIGHE